MAQDLMNYDQMTQLALRGVVRDAIRRVIREDGLPGAHHFYITFQTQYPGVDIDAGLAEKYPEEITIVIEHQFWDLSVSERDFEVTLKFGGVPKYLKIPYTAITRFHDPSVGFMLQFDTTQDNEPLSQAPNMTRLDTKPAPALATAPKEDKTLQPTPASTITPPDPQTQPKKSSSKPKDEAADKPKKKKTKSDKREDGESKVVSLDAFRKK